MASSSAYVEKISVYGITEMPPITVTNGDSQAELPIARTPT